LCRAVGGRASRGIEPEADAAAKYSIAEVRWFDLRDERNWEEDLLDDPLTDPQLTIARRELGCLGGEPGGEAWAEGTADMKVTIEKVRTLPPDLAGELMRASTAEGFTPLQWLQDDWETGRNQFSEPGEALFVARMAGRLVGICGLNRDPYVDGPGVGRLRRLYVLPGERRKGIGSRLVRRVLDGAREHFTSVHLRTLDDRSAQFFAELGFSKIEGAKVATHEIKLTG
jgi:N-acetylglutamate synthase-like GNAT family acetyltransferase